MLYNLRNNLHWIVYILGIILFPIILLKTTLSLGVVWLIFILYFWLTIAIILTTYNVRDFLYSVCFIGIIISFSIFFLHGLEELAFPQGAIMFKIEGIAQALLIFFIFTVPLIIYHNSLEINTMPPIHNTATHSGNQNTKQPHQKNQTDENWEEASIKDIESVSYEVL